MTKLLSEREIGGGPLLTVEMSKDEAEAIFSVPDHFLSHVAHSDIGSLTGAYSDEVIGIHDDIRDWLGQPEHLHSKD